MFESFGANQKGHFRTDREFYTFRAISNDKKVGKDFNQRDRIS